MLTMKSKLLFIKTPKNIAYLQVFNCKLSELLTQYA